MLSFYASTLESNPNSSTIGRKDGFEWEIPDCSRMGLSSVSYLYQYVNVPPLAYGTPGPKVAESVLRSEEYNRNPEKKAGIDTRQYWKNSDGEYPFREVSSNFHVGASMRMLEAFLLENHQKISKCGEETYAMLRNKGADVLTKGRQTWDPVNRRSVPSARAFQVMSKIFRENTGKTGHSCLEWIQSFTELLEEKEIHYESREEYTEEQLIENDKEGIKEIHLKRRVKVTKKIVKGNSVRKTLMTWATSFCSYLKSKERGKLKRRAIASANPILRMFLFAVEEFHLSLNKVVEGGTISIGGEEKKKKIIQTFNISGPRDHEESVQATEDMTKWNECLSPRLFGLMHRVFFSDRTRVKLNLPKASPELKKLMEIFEVGMYLLSLKRIWMGEGPVIENENFQSKLEWKIEHKNLMNSRTREWFEKCEHNAEDGYLKSPPGMLMGMLNAASTTLGLLAINYRVDKTLAECKCVRSSDDGMSLYSAVNAIELQKCVAMHRNNYRLLGINLSTSKTRYFRKHFGEYTSWYMDNSFMCQYGVETASLRPGGANPADDSNSIAQGLANKLAENRLNSIGGYVFLKLGIENVRRLWNIRQERDEVDGVTPRIRLIADGGTMPWGVNNVHLNEIILKERMADTKEEKEYLLKVMNPDNPFTSVGEEKTAYSKEVGTLVRERIEIPRNIFNYMRRSNETSKSADREKEKLYERGCNLAIDTFEAVQPTSQILEATGTRSMHLSTIDSLYSQFNALNSQMDFSEEEKDIIKRAVQILEDDTLVEEEEEYDGQDMI